MKSNKEIQSSAKKFKETWSDPSRGGEKQDSQQFWTSILSDVFGIEDIPHFILFEEKVALDHASFIDARIPSTKVLIEQKSRGKDLRKAIKQSDGHYLNPYQQAKRYSNELPLSEHPRWIVLSNFDEWNVYDMEQPQGDPEIIKLEDFDKEYYRLNFLIDNHQDEVLQREMEISVKAGEIVGKLYDALLKEYRNPKDQDTLKSLNELIVRLVFCLYAEDSGIFSTHMQFHDYMKGQRDPRSALMQLFDVLDTPEEKRDPYLSDELLSFPYVDGSLFSRHNTEIPRLNDEIIEILLHEASEEFNWSHISPTVFGACFESSINPETRRTNGMHYTSLGNIHKLCDPLFLDDLNAEFVEIKAIQNKASRTRKLKNFQKKIANLTFLDPACGSGNFLTETYLCLRRLENEILKILLGDQIRFGLSDDFNPIMVSLKQFYGIELNDYAVSVARTALWIAEHQSMRETEEILHMDLDFLPLKSYTNIVEGNALHVDWNDVVSSDEVDYIFGNPPFAGYSLQTKDQKADIRNIFVDKNGNQLKNSGKNDYVSCWFYKACSYIKNPKTKIAFVSTNSITQGEQVANIWKPILSIFNVEIEFAYRTFVWSSEASDKAAVHCVIIGLRKKNSSNKEKTIFSDGAKKIVKNISPYILDGPDILVQSRRSPICNVPKINKGSQPTDHGYFFLTPQEKGEILLHEPELAPYIHRVYGSVEFINDKERYCFWLKDVDPSIIVRSKILTERIQNVREFRLSSKKKATQKDADRPAEFQEIRQPNSDYLIIPRVSSENRRYIPIGFLTKDVIATDSAQILPNVGLYEFGILTSNVHNSWMRTVAGRLKSDFRYSNDIVYNNYPWPIPTKKQKALIEKTADAILKAREKYSKSTLAEMYTNLEMYPELNKAHQMNDKAVMDAYNFPYKGVNKMTEADCVAALMRMYQTLVDQEDLNKSKR